MKTKNALTKLTTEILDKTHTHLEEEKQAREDADEALDTRLTTVENKIPQEASPENPLADKAYVNTQITNAIDDLDDAGQDLLPSETINTISETNGVISVSKQDIEISQDQVIGLEDRLDTDENDIDTIESKIPNEATSSNQLADKAYVGTEIQNAVNRLDSNGIDLSPKETIDTITETNGIVSVTKQSIQIDQNQVNGLEGRLEGDEQDIDTIESKIPDTATSSNKLTDKNYVDTLVEDTIDSLDVSATTVNQDETISSISETNGKIAVSKQSIQIAQDQVTGLPNRLNTDEQDIDTIEGKIPSEASINNQLADKAYVGTQITNAVNGLDYSGVDLSPSETIDTITETDGVISVTKQDIQIEQDQVTGLEGRLETDEGDIDTIEGKIPNEASSSNQLADKEYVGTQITNAINNLDDSGQNLEPGETIDTISETNGVISVSKQSIQINESQVTNLTGDLSAIDGRLDNIEEVIPSTATSSNKLTDENAVDTKIANAINDLDVTSVDLLPSQTIDVISETNGKISVTTQNIQIEENQVTNLTSDLNSKYDKAGGVINGSVTIQGDLVVNGTESIVSQDHLAIEDKVIEVARSNTQPFTSMAGMLANNYDGVNSGGIFFDADGVGYIGDLDNSTLYETEDFSVDVYAPNTYYYKDGQKYLLDDSPTQVAGRQYYKRTFENITKSQNPELVAIAARDDSSLLTNGNFPKWDSTGVKFVDSGKNADSFEAKFTDGSATIASVSNNIVTIKGGVSQTNGAISNNSSLNDIALSKVAKTGSYNDLSNTPDIPSKDSDLTTNDRYVRFDTNAQGLDTTQKSNARTNIGVSDATITIKQEGIADQSFTLNGSATTINLKDTNTHNSHKVISGKDANNNDIESSQASDTNITLGDSGVTSGGYGDTSAQTPGYGSTFKVPYVRVNAKGIVTDISEHTVQIPASDNTNYYQSPLYNSGLKISTGTGLNDLYVPTGTNGSTVAIGNHTHSASLTSGGSSATALSENTTYTLSMGGNSVVFKTPKDTTYNTATSSVAGLVKSSTTGTTSGRDYNVQVNNDGTMKVNVPWENTWRGIQDNLTSDSSTDSLSAKQGKLLANGSARDDTKLPLSGGTLSSSTTDTVLNLKSNTTNSYLGFYNSSGNALGWLGVNSSNKPIFNYNNTDYTLAYASDIPEKYNTSGGSKWIGYSSEQNDNPTYVAVFKSNNDTNGLCYSPCSSLSVGYATSAGNADTVDSKHASDFTQAGSLGNSVDLNTINTSGLYRLSSGYSNGPDSAGSYCSYGQLIVSSGYDTTTQLIFPYGASKGYLRNGVNSTNPNGENWQSWVEVITSGNIGSQSVNYATSAGSADSATNATNATNANYATSAGSASTADALSTNVISGGNAKVPLILKNGLDGYREGLRIMPYNSWSDILLAGNDASETSGTSANSWFIGNHNGNFYITRNGADSSNAAILACESNAWTLDGKTLPNVETTSLKWYVPSLDGPEYSNVSTSYIGGVDGGPRTSSWEFLYRAQHRNGTGDGTSYICEIVSNLTSDSPLYWRKKYGGSSFTDFRQIIDNTTGFLNYGSNPTLNDGTPITQPDGANAMSLKTVGNTSDTGIFYLSDDNSYICNSSDNGYTFAVWDKDITTDFSGNNSPNASFLVKSNGEGIATRGNVTIGQKATLQYNSSEDCLDFIFS